MLERLRLKLAGKLIGDRSVLFASEATLAVAEQQRFLDLEPYDLGLMFRRWWLQCCDAQAKRGKEDGQTFDAVMTTGSVLWLAGKAHRINAETGEFTVRGSLDGGKTMGVWRVTVEEAPADYDFGPDGCETEGDGDKITKLTVTQGNPGFDAWRAERTAPHQETDNGR